jgi:hypothetical protein
MATVTPFPDGGDDGLRTARPIIWQAMPFRSQAEYRLARAFDDQSVWLMPNVRGRLGVGPNRATKELDLLLRIDGAWVGVEVDGPYPQHYRVADEHERDRLFHLNGIWVEHYTAERVYAEPDGVAAEITMMAMERRRTMSW